MDRIKKWFKQQTQAQAYSALPSDPEGPVPSEDGSGVPVRTSRFQYFIFLLLGCAMLWTWNMFMACATYFQHRFATSPFLLTNFQSLILVFSTVTNLISSYLLSKWQATANYPQRIWQSLVMNCALTLVLAASTVVWVVGPQAYIVVVLSCVVVASWSTGLSQNGVFAYVNTFGGTCMQAVMTGQALSGVLPAIAQIMSVLLVPTKSSDTDGDSDSDGGTSPRAACLYFLTATFVCALTLLLFLVQLSTHQSPSKLSIDDLPSTAPLESPVRKEVSLLTLLSKLRYLAVAIWLTFFVTMAYPVYTQLIVSVRPLTPETPRLFSPDVFIPLAFLIWNLGDLTGRVLCGFERFQWKGRPELLAVFALARVGFVFLYRGCNVRGEGAWLESDLWYWLVGYGFGVTNGWIGSSAMMIAPGEVEVEEREATGGFMGLCLVVGLATGSFASFALAGV